MKLKIVRFIWIVNKRSILFYRTISILNYWIFLLPSIFPGQIRKYMVYTSQVSWTCQIKHWLFLRYTQHLCFQILLIRSDICFHTYLMFLLIIIACILEAINFRCYVRFDTYVCISRLVWRCKYICYANKVRMPYCGLNHLYRIYSVSVHGRINNVNKRPHDTRARALLIIINHLM